MLLQGKLLLGCFILCVCHFPPPPPSTECFCCILWLDLERGWGEEAGEAEGKKKKINQSVDKVVQHSA